ncbi:predicted protein [Naegleria gruberi]|uniref:Predicted protein n=1 Tax=Naegleria gruberi TaxID=5762 RepID=D2VAX3_NAEGR|nr:uncharacterized protein NAEGRDRAFT_66010 [Naegleria gruberi]EFC46024.1 predicted protein [Naegleria gruberi]|eukprot:XP_002678768.1 predicted protein [Naegleria gruberi strain NEG-M]
MSDNNLPILHSYWRASSPYRVRIALGLKNIEYQYAPVNLLENKQASDEYMQKNPAKLLPTLEIDGLVLTQSVPIMEYLEETRPNQGVHLLPSDPIKRHTVRQITQMVASDIQPIQNLRLLKKLKEDFNVDEQGKAAWSKHWIELGFNSIEKVLEKTAGKFCVGDDVSMADCCLIPQVYGARRYGVDMNKYPIIARIERACAEMEAFKKAHPEQQVDKF